MIRASRLTARPLTARRLTAYKLGQQSSSFDPIRLFSAGEDGAWLDFTSPQVYADTAGTDPAEVGEGIAFVNDKSPNDTDATQATSTARPIFARVPVGGRRNLLVYTEEFDNAVWAKIKGGTGLTPVLTSGFIAPDGSTTAWRLQASVTNTTASDFSVLRQTITATSGSRSIWAISATGETQEIYFGTPTGASAITLTSEWQRFDANSVSASVFFDIGAYPATTLGGNLVDAYIWHPQLELGSTPTDYQSVTTQHDITEAGVPSITYANYDGVDDILPITLPAITGGTVALVGLNGIWIEDNWDYAGGTLSIGPTTIAGLPAGILDVVGDLCAVIINDRAWTAAERAGVVAWGKARGAPGVFSLGEELVTNGDFSDGDTGWTFSAPATMDTSGGDAIIARNSGDITSCPSQTILTTNDTYIASADVTNATNIAQMVFGSSVASFIASRATVGPIYIAIAAGGTRFTLAPTFGATTCGFDNVSIKKLELLP